MKDLFDNIKAGSYAWSENETCDKSNIWEHIPAGPDYQPDYDLLKSEGKETEPSKEPPAPTNCSFQQRMTCQVDTLKLFRNQFASDRAYLHWIARKILRLKWKPMTEIFKLDKSNLYRSVKKSDGEIFKGK